jgi:hypothetical protein
MKLFNLILILTPERALLAPKLRKLQNKKPQLYSEFAEANFGDISVSLSDTEAPLIYLKM